MSEENTLYSRINAYYNKKASGEDVSDFRLVTDQDIKELSSYEAGPTTVSQYDKNPKVMQSYDVLTEYLGDNRGFMSSLLDSASIGDDGPSELMRDATMRISTMANHAVKMDEAPEEVKQAYRYLRNTWNNVDVTGANEWWKFAKDYGTDVVASYETMPAILSMIFSGGTAAGAGAMTHSAAKAALHSALTKSANAVGGNTVKSAAAYAGTVTGLHDLASQDVAVDLGEREDISLGQTAGMTAFGATLGAGVAYGLKKAFSKTATDKLKVDLEEDASGVINSKNALETVEEGIEGEWIPASGGTILNRADQLLGGNKFAREIDDADFEEVIDDFVADIGGGAETAETLKTVIVGEMKSGATGEKIKSNIAFNIWKMATDLTGNFVGKSAGVLTPFTKYSKTAKTLQERLSYEFAEGFGKQKEKIGMDFSEALATISGKFNTDYLKIIEPLAINAVKGNVSDAVSKELNSAIRGGATDNKKIALAASRIQKLFKTIGTELHENGIIDKQIENYIPRMWNRKAILNNQDQFDELLLKSGEASTLREARDISDGMLDIQNQLDGGSGGQFFAAKRKFKFQDDEPFTEFLNTDLLDVTLQYNYQAGKALAKKKVLLSNNQNDFIRTWVNPIVSEMKEAGQTIDPKQILSLYQHATGEGLQRFGKTAQTVSDGYTLATRLALLPLATVGSLTEIFINIGKAGFKNSAKGFAEASEASFAKISGNLHKDLMTRHGLTSNEAWRELKKHGIAMEQAQAQIGQRLVGDDLATESMQNISNKFFRINFLDQWTKFVQMTSFASGKNLIKENLELLATHGNNPMTPKIETIIGELNSLNIDYKNGVQWIKSGAKTSDKFYDQVTAGAARYTNSVILQPTAASGLKPLAHTNPRTTVLFQLLGYPAAFTNTVIKGAVKATVKAPARNAPKLFAAGMIMTETARWMNWLRTHGESEKYASPSEARMSAIKRWGGNGLLFDNLQRASDTAKYSNTVTGFATAPFGPIMNDILNLADGKIIETTGTKIPLYTAGNVVFGKEKMREYRSLLRDKDKELKEFIPDFEYNVRKERFNKGGEVDVPNAPKEPDERINKYTGRPYNEDAGSAFMDSTDPNKVARQGFAMGSVAKAGAAGAVKLKGFIAEAINDYSNGLTKPEIINRAARQIENSSGIKASKVDEVDYDPMEADFMDMGQSFDVADTDVEDYVMTLIKVHLTEKDPSKASDPDKVSKIIKEKGADSPEYYNAMGYNAEFKDEVAYLKELTEVVDPEGELAFDITTALTDVHLNKMMFGYDITSQKNLDRAEELGLNELSEFLSHRLGVDNTISDTGKLNVVKNALGQRIDDPQFTETLSQMRDSLPSIAKPKDAEDFLPKEETTQRLEVFINKSKEKKPMYRGISSFADRDFEIAFFSPREMGVHVGARGQAEYILAHTLNSPRAVDELSVPARAFDSFNEEKAMELDVSTIKQPSWWKESDKNFRTSPEKSQTTQRGNTTSTYLKAQKGFTNESGVGLDYGAGLGEGAKAIGFKTYEPNPAGSFKPDYTNPVSIPDASVDKITSLNVLNVIEQEARDNVVKDIFRILKIDGEAIITTRGADIYGSKQKPAVANLGLEQGSVITSSGTFQKGFTQKELETYVRDLLGDSVVVDKFKGGKAGIKITKVKPELDRKTPYNKITEEELDSFYADEALKLNNFKDVDWENLTLDELADLLSVKDAVSVVKDSPALSMMKGYIQVKNPLVIDTDMGNWSADYLLTAGSTDFVQAIKKNLGGPLSDKSVDELEILMRQAIDSTNNDLENVAPDPQTLIKGVVANVDLTKKLQKWLDDLGFDSIKYRNDVEPLMDTDIGYDPYSYILFKPQQYKSILATKYDETDARFTYNKGGLIEGLVGGRFWGRDYNAEDRPLDDRIADYVEAQDIIPTDSVNQVVDYAVNSGAFDYEMQELGISKEELREGMINISKIESSGGHLPKERQVSPTGAQGLFQVLESTARGVLEPNNYFGEKAAQAAGVPLETLRNMSREELQSFLLNDDRGNALFSAAVIMQKLKHNENKKRKDYTRGGVVNANARHTNGSSYLEGRTR